MSENGRYWFHILAQAGDDARFGHAARLAEKAWLEGDRVGIFCEDEDQARTADERLWSFRPDAFIPHEIITGNDQTPGAPVAVLTCDPAPADWDTVIILAGRLPGEAESFRRLALIASNDEATLNQARNQYRQLRDLGVTPQVHDQRR